MIDFDKIAGVFHTAYDEDIEDFVQIFNTYAADFGVYTEFQENALIAQIREEVGPSLITRRENLNYSCNALKQIFRYYRNNPNEANRDGRCNNHRSNQRHIANKAYANRIGNGSYKTGDGYRFRGGGYLQTTGRSNYNMVSSVLSAVLNANISVYDVETEISTIQMGVLSAFAFYYNKNLKDCKDINCYTKKINRYTDSYHKRKQYYLHLASL